MDAIQERFEEFHMAHPQVYRQIVRIAREFKSKGYPRYSMDGILHIVRWEMRTVGSDTGYKFNNNWTRCYSRLVMSQCPDLDGFFETRRSKGDGHPDEWAEVFGEAA